MSNIELTDLRQCDSVKTKYLRNDIYIHHGSWEDHERKGYVKKVLRVGIVTFQTYMENYNLGFLDFFTEIRKQ